MFLMRLWTFFESVLIPNLTLSWLFEERRNIQFHQPSRIKNAHILRNLVATEALQKLNPKTIASSDLASQVGDELALLIAEANKDRDIDIVKKFVVRPSPVHRLSSLMDEEVDLTEYSPIMVSCLQIIEKLREKGQLTIEEYRFAQNFLKLKEKPWPSEPIVTDGATLYLDSLSVSYFLHLGLLKKIYRAGFIAFVSPGQLEECDSLISLESITGEGLDVIEKLRSSLHDRIETGHIKVGRKHSSIDQDIASLQKHSILNVIALTSQAELVVIDDRFLNKHKKIEDKESQFEVLTTLDLLEALAKSGVISEEACLGCRTRLRNSGYMLIPVYENELELYLKESVINGEKLLETAELKAVRESLLRIRMSDWLQLPEEAYWLDTTFKVFINTLKKLWVEDLNLDEVIIRSNWLARQLSIRGWAHCLVNETADDTVKRGSASYILLLLRPPVDVNESVVNGYWTWIDNFILAPLKEELPLAYEWLVDRKRDLIDEMSEFNFSELNDP